MIRPLAKFIILAILASSLSLTFGSKIINAENGNGASQLTEAETALEIIKGLDKGEDACIQIENEAKGITNDHDRGYIITILEEPLSLQESQTKTIDGADFEQRICYRHVFRYNETTTAPSLSRVSCTHSRSMELYNAANALGDKASYSCKAIQVLLSKGGTAMLYHYIGMIYRWGVSIAGIVAVLVIVLNGIRISASGGDPEAINKSKRMIIQSLAAIAVLILSGIILYTINPDFFVR